MYQAHLVCPKGPKQTPVGRPDAKGDRRSLDEKAQELSSSGKAASTIVSKEFAGEASERLRVWSDCHVFSRRLTYNYSRNGTAVLLARDPTCSGCTTLSITLSPQSSASKRLTNSRNAGRRHRRASSALAVLRKLTSHMGSRLLWHNSGRTDNGFCQRARARKFCCCWC